MAKFKDCDPEKGHGYHENRPHSQGGEENAQLSTRVKRIGSAALPGNYISLGGLRVFFLENSERKFLSSTVMRQFLQ